MLDLNFQHNRKDFQWAICLNNVTRFNASNRMSAEPCMQWLTRNCWPKLTKLCRDTSGVNLWSLYLGEKSASCRRVSHRTGNLGGTTVRMACMTGTHEAHESLIFYHNSGHFWQILLKIMSFLPRSSSDWFAEAKPMNEKKATTPTPGEPPLSKWTAGTSLIIATAFRVHNELNHLRKRYLWAVKTISSSC